MSVRRAGRLVALGVCALLAAGCRGPADDPLREITRGIETPFSVILADMDVAGNFFKTYQHRYKVVYEKAPAANAVEPAAAAGAEPAGAAGPELVEWDTDWVEVDRRFYDRHEPHLGMVLLSSDGGKVDEATYPPGYQHVGNPRYGTWRTDSRGDSFWEFYGKYALFSHLLGGHGRPIYRTDYDSYQDHRRRREPYFGTGGAYGTRGSYTRTSHPTFYERQQVRQRAKSERFTKKARSRTSSARSRSGGRGK